jgi:hypothetical protein
MIVKTFLVEDDGADAPDEKREGQPVRLARLFFPFTVIP